MIVQDYPVTLWQLRFAWLPVRAEMDTSWRRCWRWLWFVETRSVHQVILIPNRPTVLHRTYTQHRVLRRHV